ncbi:hypothetical protein [Caloramator sp. Dgby_cultured_2]|nr:hypothetical protein [Caloramator sp. Dgby_cultured_2]WDU83206.1 hypothetical protein PWK10_00025 [Caloramator sp. Dgby_cultured_2]
MNIEIIKPFEEVVHEYDNGKIKLISFLVKPLSYDYKLSVHDDARWVSIDDLLNYDLAPADIPIAKKLQEELKTKE